MQEKSFDFRGIPAHYLEGGAGYPILMIHGSGPGASTLGNFRLVLEPLAARYHVFAMDLIGFGKSGRKPAPPYFDFPLWLEQCGEMLRKIPGDRVGVIGHSISGALALKLAGADRRIDKVMTTGTMGAKFEPNKATLHAWTFPRNRDELREAAESFIYDKSLIDEAYISNREKVLFAGNYGEYFSKMFEGDKRRFVAAGTLSEEDLRKVTCDVLMVHGRDDEAFPPEPLTMAMSKSIPHADVVLLGHCSHSVAFEHPKKFIALTEAFFG